MQTFKERNYKKEYENYHSKPEQKKRRAGRNKARRSLKDNKGIVGKDVHHKDNNPLNNDKKNLSIVTQKYNRTEPRLRDEEREPQDKDIKDKEGTQPAKYFKGLKKTTKSKRDAHFKKGASKSDSDPSAYKDAPGDKKARKGDMPKSKYTKFVDNMMKEGTDFAAHRAAKATAPSDSDRKKMAKVADMMRKEREKKAAMKEGTASRWKAQDAAAASYSKEKRKPEPNPKIAALNKQLSARLKKEREQKAAMKKEEIEQFDEAIKKTPLGPKGQAAKAHITALGKKHGRSFGDQRLHIYHFPNKYDKKTNAHAKVLDQHQFGGKTEETQIDELSKKTMGSYVKKASQSAADHGMQAGRKQAERDEVDRSTNRHGNVDRDAVHKAFKTTHHDVKKPEQKAAKRLKGIHRAIGKLTKEEAQKKDHQTISYVTHGGQKGKVQVHKDNAFKALNHYRKNNKSAQFEAMSPESRKAHGRMFKAAAKKKYDADTTAAAQAEREKRLKAKGWVKNDRGGMSKVSEEADKSLAAKAAKSGISVGTLKKVYNRGVAAWKTGHRPGTTPSQWGHARVNAFITKKKKGGLNHDKDLA